MPRWPATYTRLCGWMGLLLAFEYAVSMSLHHVVLLRRAVILPHHFADELLETDAWTPPEARARLGRVSQQRVHLGRPEVPRIDFHDGLADVHAACEIAAHRGDHPDLVDAVALPAERHAEMRGGDL